MICFTFSVDDSYYSFFRCCYSLGEDVLLHAAVIDFGACLKLSYFFALVVLLSFDLLASCITIFFLVFFSTSLLSSVFAVTIDEINQAICPSLFRKHSFLAFMRLSLIKIITLLGIHLCCHLLRSFIRLAQVLIHLRASIAVIVRLF